MVDDKTFVEEVTGMQDMLYRLSVSYLRHDQDAQDAVSQAIENAWRHRSRVAPQAFRPWLTRIVINECKTLLRKRRRVAPLEDMTRCAGMSQPPDIALADAISRLPETLRTPLLLHHMEGFSVSEIARALFLTETAVKSRLHRARKALRRELDDKEGGKA